MDELTVNEAVARKKELEKKLSELFKEFTDDTGLEIYDTFVNTARVTGSTLPEFYMIELTIRL